MLTEFSVEQFRSLRSVHLTDLKRINILVGRSGSGKTAILEAIRAGLGATPAMLWNLTAWRGGIQLGPQGPNNEQFEAIWRPYFFDFDTSEKMVFSFKNTEGKKAIIRAYFDESAAVTSLPFLQQPPNMVVTPVSPLVFDRTDFEGVHSYARAFLNQGQLQFEQSNEIGVPAELITASNQLNAPQIANWFSSLSVDDNDQEIIQAITESFPEVYDISVQSPQGVSLIYASLKSQRRKLPISSVSSGLNKLVAILVAIRTFSGGVVLIDEVENGIYFEMFPKLWDSLIKFAELSKTQVIVTTHSYECLKSVFNKNWLDSISVYQIHQEDGETKAHFLSGKDAASAIEIGVGVRQ